MAEATQDCGQCARVIVMYEGLKDKIMETSVLIAKNTEANLEAERLRRQLQDSEQLVESLSRTCDRYREEVCSALTQLDTSKQRCNRLQTELNLVTKERDELQVSCSSIKSTLRQYEALVEKYKNQEPHEPAPKPSEGKHRVAYWKNKLEKCKGQNKQLKQSFREAQLENKHIRTRCRNALERVEVLGKRLKEREMLGRKEDQLMKRIMIYLGVDAEAASSSEDESDVEQDARHLEELLMADVYDEAEIPDVETILDIMRLPPLLSPLPPDEEPTSVEKPELSSQDLTEPELPAPCEPVALTALPESSVPSEWASSVIDLEQLEQPRSSSSAGEPASLAALPASLSRPALVVTQLPPEPDLFASLPELGAPPEKVPVKSQPVLSKSSESVTHLTQPGSVAQPKSAPLEAQTGLKSLPECALKEAPTQPGLPGLPMPILCAEQLHSPVLPRSVSPEAQTGLGMSLEPVSMNTQPKTPIQPGLPKPHYPLVPPKPVPLEMQQTELGASLEPAVMETQPEASGQGELPESPEPIATSEQSDSPVPLKPEPLVTETELGASPEPVLMDTQLEAPIQPGLPESLESVAWAEQSETDLEDPLMQMQPRAPTEPALADSPRLFSSAREQDLVVPLEPVPFKMQTQLEASSELVLIGAKLEAPAQSSPVPLVAQPELPELREPSFVTTETKLPASSPDLLAPPEPGVCAVKADSREASSEVPRAQLESTPASPDLPTPLESILCALSAELPMSPSVSPHAIHWALPPETPQPTSLATQLELQAAPKAGSVVTLPALQDPALLATWAQEPVPAKLVPLVTEAELQATSSDPSSPVSHLKLFTSPQPTSTSPASALQPQALSPEPSRVPSPLSPSPVLPGASEELLVLPELSDLSWEPSLPEPSPKKQPQVSPRVSSLKEPRSPPESPSKESRVFLPKPSPEQPLPRQPRMSLPERPPEQPWPSPRSPKGQPEQSQEPPPATLGTAAGPSRQLVNAQVVKSPEGLDSTFCIRIPRERILSEFGIGPDVAKENVNVSCQGAAVLTVSLQTATPSLMRAPTPGEECLERPAFESAENRVEGPVVGPVSVSRGSSPFQLKEKEEQWSGEQCRGGVLGAGGDEPEGGGRTSLAQRGACRQREAPLHEDGPAAREWELPGSGQQKEEIPPQALEKEPVPAIRVSPRRKRWIARERRGDEKQALSQGQQVEPSTAIRVSPRRRQQIAGERKGDGNKASGGGQPEEPLQVLAPPCKQGPVVEPLPRKRQWLARQRQSTEAHLPSEGPGAPKQELPQVLIRPWSGPLLGAHRQLPTRTGLARQRPPVGEQPPNQPLLQGQAPLMEASPVAERLSERKQSAEDTPPSVHQQPEEEFAPRVAGQPLEIRQGWPQVKVGPWSGPLLGAQRSVLSKMRLARERSSIEEQPPNQQREEGPGVQQAPQLKASPLAEPLSKGKQQSAIGSASAEKQPSACQQPGEELAQGRVAPKAAGQSLGIRHMHPAAAVPVLAREKQCITRRSSGEQQQREDAPLPKKAHLPESSPGAKPVPVEKPWLARQTTAEQCPSGGGLPGMEFTGKSPQQPVPKQGVPVGSRQLPQGRVSWFTRGSIRGPKEKQQEAKALPQSQALALATEPEEEPSSVVDVLPLRKQRVARVRRCAEEQPLNEQRRSSASSGEEQSPSEELHGAGEEPSRRPAPAVAGPPSSPVVGPKMKLRSASKKPGASVSDGELKREMQLLGVRVVVPRCAEVPEQLSAGTKRTLPQQQMRTVSQPPEGPLPKKRPRLDKQQLRELFAESSDSEEDEEEEEEGQTQLLPQLPPQPPLLPQLLPQPQPQKHVKTELALSQDCAAVTLAARNALQMSQAVKKALVKLSALSTKKAVHPDVLSPIIGSLQRDRLVLNTLVFLAKTKANPQSAFYRGKQTPPLVTRFESLLLQVLALHPGGQRAMLSAVRARLWSRQRPQTLHGQASYVRLACALCRELHEPGLARMFTWDLLGSNQAPFLVAAAVGAWPKMFAAFPKGPVLKTLSYMLLHSPVHSLKSTLVKQARNVLQKLGPLAPTGDSEQQLVEELLRPLLNPHKCTAMLADACLMHRLCLKELCRRSSGALLPWLLCQQLAPQLAALAAQPQASCLLRLLGSLARIYCGDLASLKPLLQQLEAILLNGEPALQQLAAEALQRIPKIDSTRWMATLNQWRLEKRQREAQQPEPARPPAATVAQAVPRPASSLPTRPRTAAQFLRKGAQ